MLTGQALLREQRDSPGSLSIPPSQYFHRHGRSVSRPRITPKLVARGVVSGSLHRGVLVWLCLLEGRRSDSVR